jgi:hypothetical protein
MDSFDYGDLTDPDIITGWSRAARAVIREYEKRQWRPVSVRPKVTGAVYAVRLSSGVLTFAHFWANGWPYSITHWQPMPKGPR